MADLLSCADLGPRHKIVTVLVTETEKGWIFDRIRTTPKTFIYMNRMWLDEQSKLVESPNIRIRLLELLIAAAAEDKLDQYVSTL